jgi:hypothetical protein
MYGWVFFVVVWVLFGMFLFVYLVGWLVGGLFGFVDTPIFFSIRCIYGVGI